MVLKRDGDRVVLIDETLKDKNSVIVDKLPERPEDRIGFEVVLVIDNDDSLLWEYRKLQQNNVEDRLTSLEDENAALRAELASLEPIKAQFEAMKTDSKG